jgi:translocation and assembly module TamB
VAEPGGRPHGEHPDRRARRDEGSSARGKLALVEDPNGLRWGRAFATLVAIVLGLVMVAVIAVFVLTNTDWGRERIRRYAQAWINGTIHGQARIGRITGNLLTGMTVHDFVITDSAGKPFVAVESFHGSYSIFGLLHKRISVDQAVAVRAIVVLDKPPSQPWNWQRIFPRDTTPKPPSKQVKWGDWLRFTNATVIGGQLIVTSPWKPSSRLSQRAQDSVVRNALKGDSRLLIKRVPGGFQKIVQLDTVNAKIPLLRLSQPGIKNRLVEISSLNMTAYPFRPPAAKVRDLKGIIPFNNDSAWWKGAYAELPKSRATGDGIYNFDNGDLTLTLHGDPASFADLRWVYPRLPSDGRGVLDFKLVWRGALEDYQVSRATVTIAGARTTGSFGITLGDTITIHNTDLHFTGVQTRTLEQMIPNFKSPRRGTFAGHAIVAGGRNALAVNGDVTFADQVAGVSRVQAVGGIGFPGRGVRAADLHVKLMPAQVDLARTWMPTLPIHGTITGSGTVNGSTDSELRIVGDIDHRDRGTRSVIDGRATVHLAGGFSLTVDARARPISLVEVGRSFPSAGLQGSAAGPFHLSGTMRALRASVDFMLPDGGRLDGHGVFDVAGRDAGYDLTAHVVALNTHTIDFKAPSTSLTGTIVAKGRGFDPTTMHSTIAAEFSRSRWDTLRVDSASIRTTIADGLAQVPKLYLAGSHIVANASGAFGLRSDRTGQLRFTASVDSLGAFNHLVPKQNGTKAMIPPRPGIAARELARAKADSARVDRATQMERLISGRPAPKLAVKPPPKPVPADTISGSAFAAGTVTGNIYQFTVEGRAAGDRVNVRGNYARSFKSQFVWRDARTPEVSVAVGFDADSVSVMGFAFDTVNVRLTYRTPGGRIEVAAIEDQHRQYSAKGDYAFFPDRKQIRLADMRFQFDTAQWTLVRPSLIAWGGPGVRVTDLELRNRGAGRVYANGLLPTSGSADFRVDIDNFPISNIVDIAQTDIPIAGVLTLHGTMRGSLSAPTFHGAFGVVSATYDSTKIPITRGTFDYSNEQLVAHAEALQRNGEPMTTADARLPINLAVTGVTGDRLLPRPMSVDITGDSLPIDLIPELTDVVTNVHGHAAGRIAMRGTLRRPSLTGGLVLDRGTMTITASGATIEDIAGTVRMADDTVYVDSIAGWAKGPVWLSGIVAVGDWRDPSFNLHLRSSGAELLANQYGKLRADADVAFTGPFTTATLKGNVTVTQGVIYAPEPTGRHVIGAGDPALFNVIDTAVAADRNLFPAPSPLLANLTMDVSLSVKHNTWVRNREANIEIYTDDPLTVHAEQQAFDLTGVVTTDRGEYNFLSRRFQIKRGSAIFIGSPDLNPTLQITGEYQVVTAVRGTLNIRVSIGGTLRQPKLSLESDAQPPRTQSELLSLLAFGQTTSSLLGSASSSIASTAATSDLFGIGAQYAVRRLASVALGVAVDQVEMQAGRAFGTDVFDITPGDVPSSNFVGNFITQTKVEAGKYVNPRTFVSVQTQAAQFGAAIDHRTADGWQFNASFGPRILLGEPRLDSQPFRTITSYGGFILRDWRF